MDKPATKIELREITRDNWVECVRLKVDETQKNFVASNDNSLAMAAYEPGLNPRAIYNSEDTMVGFIMYGWWDEKGAWWIARMMVDKGYQGQGYGRAAIEQAIEVMEQERPGQEIGLSFEPANHAAAALYAKLGFQLTGEDGDGETVMRKPRKA